MTVSATPTGYADAVVSNSSLNDGEIDTSTVRGSDVNNDGKFLMPHEDDMTMNEFLDINESPSSSPGIHYIQKQVWTPLSRLNTNYIRSSLVWPNSAQ